MKIEDNFLEQKDFDELQIFIMGNKFDWYYSDIVDNVKDVDKYQFTHTFYRYEAPRSSFCEKLNPILEIIDPISLWRIKANLLTKTPTIVENEFHVDIDKMPEERLKQWTTSIFYINTNNGYTEFEDGTKVESVANRMVTFPSNLKHRGTSCTDEKTRVIINFNYFAQQETMKYVWLIYLQFLFVAGQFNAKKNWIDKHILICYNKLDELNVDYVKFHDFDKKE